MSTLLDIAVGVLQRLEEDTVNPIFWNLQNEVLPLIVEGINEAALLSGVVQTTQSAPLTLPANTTYLPMPLNALALLRIQGPASIQKTTAYALDALAPGWQNFGGTDSGVQQIQYWFPVGLTQFGIYPQLAVDQQVRVTYLAYPLATAVPYAGTELVPFQQEFQDAIEEYATHVLRLKESGFEFQSSQAGYQAFLDTMRALSVFQSRRDSLVFTATAGARARVMPVEVR